MKLRIEIHADIVVDGGCTIFQGIEGNKITVDEYSILSGHEKDEYVLIESEALAYAEDIIELTADWDFVSSSDPL
jgi:hypothetical protein